MMVSAFATVASAEVTSIKTEPTKSELVIDGKVEGTSATGTVSVNILAPGYAPADITPQNIKDVVAYSNQAPINKDGTYKITAKITKASGDYTVYVDDGNTAENKKVTHVIKADNEKALEAITGAADEDASKTAFTNYWSTLGFDGTLYSQVSKDDVAVLFFNLKTETALPAAPVNPTDAEAKQYFDDVEQYFTRAVTLQAIKEGKIAVLADTMTLLDVAADSTAMKWYNKRASSNPFLLGVKGLLKGGTYKNLAEYKAALDEAIVLNVICYPDGTGDIKNVMADYKTQIGITSDLTTKTDVYEALSGKIYSNYSQVNTAYAEALASQGGGDHKKPGGTGGGYAGGSNIGGPSVGIPDLNVKPEPVTPGIFTDLDSVPWAEKAILNLFERKIVSGKELNKYYPNDPLTREQFVTMLVKAFGFEMSEQTVKFNDVKQGDWYYDSVMIAASNGIVSGMGADFGVGVEISRQDMAVMVYNTLIKKGLVKDIDIADEEFADYKDISDYAYNAVMYLKNAGIINGVGDNCFEPKSVNTRAQAAVVVNAVLQ